LLQRFVPGVIKQTDDSVVSLVHAPYGGLLLHRDVIERIGYPNQDFVVYSDDLEYTERLTASGGAIGLVIESQIVDLEAQGHDKGPAGKGLFPILSKGDDATVFYAARNQAYLDHRRGAKSAIYGLNRSIYLALLWVVARLRGRTYRFRLIAHAVRDGEAGRLGKVDVGRLL
jgi:GT2 family glycosyltransferase